MVGLRKHKKRGTIIILLLLMNKHVDHICIRQIHYFVFFFYLTQPVLGPFYMHNDYGN